MLKYGTAFGDFSQEHLRPVSLDRNYLEKPNTNALLYEIIPWRNHADFKTFRRLYETLMEKE